MAAKSLHKVSAGVLLYPERSGGVEVLLGHPGGPYWRNKDLGSWSIPKGLIADSEPPLTAAMREFAEETGHNPEGASIKLGEAKQPGGKIVHVWAVEGDWKWTNCRAFIRRWSGHHDQDGSSRFRS
jgi:predicted NUDIX family NTP pyrophosphohydrolase